MQTAGIENTEEAKDKYKKSQKNNDIDFDLPKNEKIRETLKEDPLLMFFWKNRNLILWLLIIVLGSLYAKKRFNDYYLSGLKDATATLTDLQQKITEYSGELEALKNVSAREIKEEGETNEAIAEQKAKQEEEQVSLSKNIEDISVAIKNKLSALKTYKSPYPKLASSYEVLFLLKQNQTDYKELLAKIDKSIIGDASIENSLFSELPLLQIANMLLDTDAGKQEGFDLLKELASRGAWVNTAASLVLSSAAKTPEERLSIKQIIQDIIAKEPSQTDLLASELDKL